MGIVSSAVIWLLIPTLGYGEAMANDEPLPPTKAETTISGRSQMSESILELTLDHPRPESRTRWRIPAAYLSPHFKWENKGSTSIIDLEAALPDMGAWRTSQARKNHLRSGRRDDSPDLVTVTLQGSYDFAIEQRLIPKLLRQDLEFVGDYDGEFSKYRQVRKNKEGEITQIINTSSFFLFPKQQIPGRSVYFQCFRRCSANADYSATIHLEVGFDLELLHSWQTLDQQVRALVDKFFVK